MISTIGTLILLLSPSVSAADYPVGPGDSLMVHVQDEADLSRTIRVSDGCSIEIGLIGSVPVCGQNTDSIAEVIRDRLADGFLRYPQVSVEVAEYYSQRVVVSGAVKHPGEQVLQGETSMLQVIAAAGGRTTDNVVEAAVIRDGQVYTYFLPELEQGLEVLVQANDRVILRSGRVVYVQGEVRREGPVVFRDGLTVTQALSMAGGPGDFASLRKAWVVRADGDKVRVNVRAILDGKEAEVPLSPDDRLVIRRSHL